MKKVNYLFLFIFVLPFRYMLIELYTSFDQIIIVLLTAKWIVWWNLIEIRLKLGSWKLYNLFDLESIFGFY